MKLSELFLKQAKKLGIDTTTPEYTALVTAMGDTDVPEAIATRIDTGLLTIAAAKSNSELIGHFRAQNLDPADQRMLAIATELGIDLDDDFKGTTSSYDKIQKLVKLSMQAGEKKNGAQKPADVKKWEEKEADYNRQIAEAKQALTAKDADWQNKLTDKDVHYAKREMLFGKDYIFPKEMDMNTQISTAQNVVESELIKSGFKIVVENGQRKIVNKDGAPAYGTDNVALEPDTYITGVLTRNGLLKINNAPPAPAAPGAPGNPGFIPNPAPGAGVNNAVAAELDQQLKTM